ncbi:Uu.00g089790.m01.CDS01 [Anthostomella pinea]|uniref:DSC E3 ubiquitin ligase complex subunit A n=1 Tax=Anthostomella pinea TaxID=933095 RepID=A0AAI8VHC1_9PEZI|nr:Uu.00g089790.m01.CDS01 [Anthostomella pinea]
MPPPQDNARVLFLILVLFWLVSSPDSGPGLIAGPGLVRNRLARHRYAHGILNSTNWGDFAPRLHDDPLETEPKYLNITGFREEDTYVWEDLGRFRTRCEEWSRNAVGIPEAQQPVWQNATGVVRGLWDRTNTSSPRFHSSYNLSAISPGVNWNGGNSDWGRNVTGSEGKILLRIDDDENASTEPEKIDPRILLEAEVRAREVAATVSIDDIKGIGSNWEMRLHGVHWPRQGAMLLTTTSEKFAGIFGLPHLTTRPDFFQSSQALLNRTLDRVLERKERRTFTDQTDPWTSTVDAPGEAWNPTPHCEYLLYIQIHPLDRDIMQVQPSLTGPENVVKAIQDIEHELRFPQGVPHKATPRLQMSSIIYSPDCGFFLESKGPPAYAPVDGEHLVGVKQEVFIYSVSTWLLGLALVIFGQVQLLKLQMRETSTPSTLGRVSFYTMSMMLLADGIIFAGSTGWSLSASTTLLPSLVVTCVSCLAASVGAFFLFEIHKVQEPERRRQERNRERQNPAPANTSRPASTPADVPVPASANAPSSAPGQRPALTLDTAGRPPSPPIIIPSDQDLDAEIAEVTNNNANATLPAPVTAGAPAANAQSNETPLTTIIGRLLLIAICTIFLSLAASTWRPGLRSAYFNTVAFVYLSFWTPQIYRNVYRNCRRALSWQFVIGQSILRSVPIAYFYIWADNFAFAETDWTAFAVLAGWVWIQIWALVAQSVLGPRFGIPKGWMPEAWEYHPVLREDNMEAGGLPIGLVSASSSPTIERVKSNEESRGERNKHTNIHAIDCAICREALEVPVVRAGHDDPAAGGVAGVFARRMYMVTPCRHIFHSVCLEGWMRFRLQCPICREELPPL